VAAVALAGVALGAAALAAARPAARGLELEPLHFKSLALRSVGPANMGGRISDFAVVASRPATFFVATGTGGLFKTTNLGTTWSALFDKQAVASIGAVAVWQRNPQVVWAGTGEANSRNSSSWGNGVFRSTDGGSSWKHLGLEATRSIGRVVLDPADSNVVYVAALGRLWGENRERGVFVTRDGGKTWTHSLKVDARTGAVDLTMDPKNARVLYAAMYARKRTPWSYQAGGKSGGIFKTTDGGRSWTKLHGGLPATTGRIGLDVYRRDPRQLLAVIESDEGGQLGESEGKSRTGGVFRSEDGGQTWTRMSPHAPRGFYFSQIRVQPDDSSRVYLLGLDLYVSDDGGRTFRARGGRNLHPDFHAMWIHPEDGDRLLVGTDGGLYLSHDRGVSWDFINNLALGEVYNVAVDTRRPYRIYAGMQDNQTWGGPSATRLQPQSWLEDPRTDGISNDDWYCLGGGDGFHVAVDPGNPDIVYYESQGGWVKRLHLDSGRERLLRPSNREGEPRFRFNWNAPFMISPHDSTVLWLGGNHLFRLYERGDKWERVSPDLTTMNPQRMATGGSNAETHCTIVTLDESPLRAGLIWVGTDDGKVWLTRDGGGTWTDVTRNLRGVPAGLYMSRIEASHHDPGTAYLAVDGHRTDDERPHLMVTRDYGRTWKSIAAGLPAGNPVKVVREDPANPRLLFAGTEFGLYLSLDDGERWMRLTEGLPRVAVDDLLIHPRERDLVVGTHGRSVYVLDDITALEHWTPAVARDPVTLFPPRKATAFLFRDQGGRWGQAMWSARNPPFGATLQYFVREHTGEGVSLTIENQAGKTVRTLSGPATPGLQRVTWDLQIEPAARIGRPEWSNQPEFVPAGRYTVKLRYGKEAERKQTLEVEHAPGLTDGSF
jgi:photosystem II stability/assembly factor-like uncharacterized protein